MNNDLNKNIKMNKKNNVRIVASVKMILLFCVQSAIALIIFFFLISNGKYAGGDVGMTPFTEMFFLLVQFLILIVIYFATRKLINIKYHYVYIIVNILVLIVIFTVMLGVYRENLLNEIIKDNADSFFLRCSLLAQLISTVLALIVYFVVEKLEI